MKSKILTLILFIASLMNAQNKLPDNGISGEVHRKYLGSGFFSNKEVLFKKEDLSTEKTEFTWGEPIYGRFYWAEGINNHYVKNGWKKPYDTYRYVIRYFANGKLFKEHISQTNGERTSLPVCLYRASYDTYNWNEMRILAQNTGAFKPGKNTIKIEVCPYERASNRRSEPVATASFTLNMPASAIQNTVKLKKIETAWKKWDEWKINGSTNFGYLRSTWGKTDKWEYKLGDIKGKIELSPVREDQWTLTSGDESIKMEQVYGYPKEWNIIDGTHSYHLKPVWPNKKDYWKEWEFTTKKGSMKIESTWNKKDEWDIKDNMPDKKPEIKLAAVFMVIYLTNIK